MNYSTLQNVVLLALIITFSAGLHLVWESSHVGLYAGYEGLSGDLPITVWATMGDILYVLGAIFVVSLFKNNLSWLRLPRTLDYAGLMIMGFWIALYVEYKALALERWFYLEGMPIIPGFEVGLTPILQMTLLLPLAVFLASFTWRVVQRS